MAIKTNKPTSPGRRFQSTSKFEDIDTKKAEQSLLKPVKSTGGRNSMGRMTIRHRGGGHKRMYRVIDFKRDQDGIPARVAAVEYDPNRSANIALLHYVDGEKRYILAPNKLQMGDRIVSGTGAEIRVGNAIPLRDMPLGTIIHNIELNIGHGGQVARGAGSYAQLMAKEGKYAQIKLPSGEVRMVLLGCKATIGQVGNLDHEKISLGKAGRSRWLGKRPRVRGVAMNPVDHPHGGGEGRSPIGMPGPKSPWGKPTLGYKTRRNKSTSKYILRSRHAAKRK